MAIHSTLLRWVAGLVLLLVAAASVTRAAPVEPASHAVFLPLQAHTAYIDESPHPLIFAFVPDGLAPNDIDEAIAIQNTSRNPVWLTGWQLTDGEGTVTLPDILAAPGQIIWCTRQAAAFRLHWGAAADCEYETDSDPAVPNASGRSPNLGNTGDEVQLLAPDGVAHDSIPYAGSAASLPGWTGPAVPYYQANARFGREGQVFYRLFDPASSLALPKSGSAHDWAQGNPDPQRGRRTAYPGWDLLAFARPASVLWPGTAPTARLLVAPDNTFASVASLFASARDSIHLEVYELKHPDLTRILAQRAAAGVEVSLLLEGGPTGGLDDAERWAAQQITAAGGEVRFMVNDGGQTSDRYAFLHAKFAIIDGQILLVSTENLSPESHPPDASDGETWGRRGYGLIVNDPSLVAAAEAIFQADNDPDHRDILSWRAGHPTYGAPPPDYVPPTSANLSGYTVHHPTPITLTDLTAAHLATAPEASLSPGPLLDLIDRAQAGDVIYAQQLYEHTFWGGANDNAASAPNARLQALIDAARRGAIVRLLLDSYFDETADIRSNAATTTYVNQIADHEGLNIEVATGNPTGTGIHAKLHLLALGAERWVVLGSINGGEVSNKINREMMIAFQSVQAHAVLEQVFLDDWAATR